MLQSSAIYFLNGRDCCLFGFLPHLNGMSAKKSLVLAYHTCIFRERSSSNQIRAAYGLLEFVATEKDYIQTSGST